MVERLAVVASHPVQYQAPWFRALARVVELEVLYCHRPSPEDQAAAGFDVPFEWDTPLLEGYDHRFLVNRARRPGLDRFTGCDTPDIGGHLRRRGFAACLVLGWQYKSYLQAWWACRRHRIPVLCRGDSQLAAGRSPLRRLTKRLVYPWFLRSFSAHLAVGSRNRAYLLHYGVPPERIGFAPHSVDNAWWATRARLDPGRRAALRAEWGVPDGGTAALFVGRLVPEKRPEDFIAAISRCSGAVRGVVVGDGRLAARLRGAARALSAPIVFQGFRNQSELPAIYAAADVLVLPSASETWGLVVNEALACGTWVVVSEAAGCAPDLVVEGSNGYVFPCGDVAALSSCLRRITAGREPDLATVEQLLDRHSFERAVEGTLAELSRLAPSREV